MKHKICVFFIYSFRPMRDYLVELTETLKNWFILWWAKALAENFQKIKSSMIRWLMPNILTSWKRSSLFRHVIDPNGGNLMYKLVRLCRRFQCSWRRGTYNSEINQLFVGARFMSAVTWRETYNPSSSINCENLSMEGRNVVANRY